MAETLNTVTVYRFRLYDITTDTERVSRRLATREAIEQLGGKTVEGSGVEIDASFIGAELPGMTERGFNPNPQRGFQRQVTA